MKASEMDNSGRTTSGLITLDNYPRRFSATFAGLDRLNRGPNVVIVFPLHRRANMVRKIAAALDCRSYPAGRRYWSLHVQNERAKLKRAGLSQSKVDAEIRRYASAISRALHHREISATPDSAA